MKGLLLLMSMIARFVAAEVFPSDVDEPMRPLVVNITNKKAHLSALRAYQIKCATSGSRPEAVITWWKGNHQVKHMTYIRNFAYSPNVTESVLSYVPTIEDDGKYLTCRAENPVIHNSALEDRWQLVVYYAPIVTIKLGPTLKADDINEGDDVYFECDVQANPEAFTVVDWYKDGKELHPATTTGIFFPNGRSLVLRSVTRNSAGEYSCTAFNSEGESTSKPLTLEVMLPMIEVSAVAGLKAQIPCDIDPASRSEVVSMVFWYKDGRDGKPIYSLDARGKSIAQAGLWSDPYVFGDRATMRTNVKPAKLEIDLLEAADAGVYRCRVDYKNSPTRNQKVNLTVIVPPNMPVIYTGAGTSLAKTLQSFNEGSELSLLCEVIGGSPPPRVTWHSEGKLLDDTYTFEHGDTTKNRLDISKVTREFLGARLTCRAGNTDLVPDLTSEIMLDVKLKPLVVNITNKQKHLSALKTYDIECATSGSRPKAVITWWKGNHEVKHMDKTFADSPNVTKSVLSYVPTIEDDGKYLTCRAENPVIHNSAMEDRWQLVVYYVPIVTVKLGSSLKANDINEGNDVYFECDVQANPKAYNWVIWYKDGKELRPNVTAGIYLHSGRSLVLRNVTKHSAGEYSCTASNIEGKSSSKPITLDIMYAPICKEGSSTQVVGALKHETISLVCGVQSKPPPMTFHWTFNNSGELMNVPANRFTHVKPLSLITSHWHGSRLNYTPANDMDYGTVACWAKNRIGVQKTPCLFQIIVAGKPYPLQNCTALQSTGPYAYRMGHEDFKATDSRDADWLIVRCSGGFDGGLPLTNYELEVYSEENVYHVNTIYLNHTEKSSSSGPVFEVPGLEPGRKYRLHLYAVNAKGRSDPVVLEPVTLKAVAMYTTDRGTSDDNADYSLLVACFASGITAVCILIVGVTLTLYRRSHPMQSIKTHSKVVQYGNKENRVVIAPLNKESRDEIKGQIAGDMADDDPDVIPNKMDKRANVFEPNYETAKLDKTKDFSHLEELDYPSPSSVLHTKDSWVYLNGSVEKVEKNLSPLRPSTLPVHRSHDIYTRSLRVQESCI